MCAGIYNWAMKSHKDRNYVDLFGMQKGGRAQTQIEPNPGLSASPKTQDFGYSCALAHQMMNCSFVTSEWGNFGKYRATTLRATNSDGTQKHPILVKVAQDWEDFNNAARFGFNMGQKTGRALTQALVALGDRLAFIAPIASPIATLAAGVARAIVAPLLMVAGALASLSISIGLVSLRFTVTLALELTLALPLIRLCLESFKIKVPGLIMYKPAIKTSHFIGKMIAGAIAMIPTAGAAAAEAAYLALITLANLKKKTTPDDYSKLTAPLDQLIGDIQLEVNVADKESDKHQALCKLQQQLSSYKKKLEPRTNFTSYLRDLVPITQDYEIELNGETFKGIMGACSETQNMFKRSYNWITGVFKADPYFETRSMATDPIAANIAKKLELIAKDDTGAIASVLSPPPIPESAETESEGKGCLEWLKSLVSFERVVIIDPKTFTTPRFAVGKDPTASGDGAAGLAVDLTIDASISTGARGGPLSNEVTIPTDVGRMTSLQAYNRGRVDADVDLAPLTEDDFSFRLPESAETSYRMGLLNGGEAALPMSATTAT